MKKAIFIATLFSFSQLSTSAFAACKNKIDNSKVMLFVDTNNSELEIATVEKSACDRGQRLMVVPENQKEYIPYTNKLEKIKDELTKCLKSGVNCEEIQNKSNSVRAELFELISKQPSISDQVENALKKIQGSTSKIESLTISGHDGGGHFGGYKGSLSRSDLAKIFSQYPNLNKIQSLLLLGCYTGVTNEVVEWKNIFPDVKLIGGYDLAAPLSSRPQGHQYISQLLGLENKLIKQANEKRLVQFTKKNLTSLEGLNAAAYLICDNQEQEEFYYSSKDPSKTFKKLNLKECLSKTDELKAISEEFTHYFDGTKEIPEDTTNGALRQLYNKARAIEHCSSMLNVDLNVNKIFNLLFYNGVKKNFSEYYKDDLAKISKILSEVDPILAQKRIDTEINQIILRLATEKKEIDLLEENPDEYIKKKSDKYEIEKNKFKDLLNDPAYSSLKKLYNDDGTMKPIDWNTLGSIDYMKYWKVMSNANQLQNINYAINTAKNNPQIYADFLKRSLKQQEDMANSQMIEKSSSAKALKEIWIPDEKNLSTKTRKELLENSYRINAVLSSAAPSEKERKALQWLNLTTDMHLRQLANPFSWHEFSGAPEQPLANETNHFDENAENSRLSIGHGGGYYMPGQGITGGTIGGVGAGSGMPADI